MEPGALNELANWIVKYIRNELTDSERTSLKRWIEQSEENKAEFERISSEAFLVEQRKEELSYSASAAYRRFIASTRKQRRMSLFKLWSRVAAVIMFMVSGGWWLWHESEAGQSNSEKIVSGSSMARLTLAEGQVIELKGQMSDVIQREGLSVNITGEQLKYLQTGEATADLNTLEVPRRGEFRLILADGTKVWLNSETVLSYPQVFIGDQREVFLSGEAYFEVAPDRSHPFIVNMEKGSKVEVLGTAFNVRSYENEAYAQTTLVHGSVNIQTKGKNMKLLPGEQAIIGLAEASLEKRKVNVTPYTAWKDGRFVFRKQSLEDIMRTAERWYDVKVVYASEELRHITFSGNIERYENFDKIIHMLEMTRMVKFTVKGNQIMISKK